MVDSKFGVIRQGERDFTVKLSAGGLKVAALGDNADFMARMAEAPDEEIRLALTYAAPVTGGLAEDRARLLSATAEPHWRTRALAHMGAVLDGSRIWHSQFPVAGQRVMGFPFIKKSREPVHYEWRNQIARAIESGAVPAPSKPAMTEMASQQAAGRDPLPHWVTPTSEWRV